MKTPVHVIDITNMDELLDLITVGNIIEFASALDHRTYDDIPISREEHLEQEFAMTRYHTFIRWFSKQFCLVIGNAVVNVSYIFKRQLISFGVTLGLYVSREHSAVQQVDRMKGITPAAVKKLIRHHIKHFWCDVLPAFDKMVENPSAVLYYVGPTIEIVAKTPDFLARAQSMTIEEESDFKDAPIFLCSNAPTPLIVEPTAEKRTHVGGLTSPSTSSVPKRRK